MDLVALIGRILFSLLFLGSAFDGHFGATDASAGYAESRGLKGARMLVLLTGAQLAPEGSWCCSAYGPTSALFSSLRSRSPPHS